MSKFVKLLLLLTLLVPALAAAQSANSSNSVTLRAGDALRIEIWREDDLSGEYIIDESGHVTLPLLGPKRVTDRTVGELRAMLLEEYRQQLRNPSINITPLRRVTVLGEVQRPGMYGVDPTVSLAGVVGLAQGTTPTGDLRRIELIRAGTGEREVVAATATLDEVDVRSGDQILVGRRSWFDRNSTFLVSALLSVTSIIITLVR
jgi:protein involved in polysaccharide export with SLBB domain